MFYRHLLLFNKGVSWFLRSTFSLFRWRISSFSRWTSVMTCRTLKFVSNNAWLISCFRRISLIKVPSQCVGTELSLSILVTGALTLVSPVNRSLLDKATTKTAKRQMEAFIMFLYLESIRLSLKIVVMRFWSFYMFLSRPHAYKCRKIFLLFPTAYL